MARYGVLGATISRIASGVGVTRAALYKFFPDQEAMLEAAADLVIQQVPRWIDESSGSDVFEHLMDMGRQHERLSRRVFESFTRPWFQFIAGSSGKHMRNELAKRQLWFIRDCTVLIEQGKRDGSIREDADTNLIAWSLMMWGWANDVAVLLGVQEMMGAGTSVEIFERMLAGIAGPSHSGVANHADEQEATDDMVSRRRELASMAE